MAELKEIFSNIGFGNFTSGDTKVFFTCLMGVGSVFIGLILLIFVCKFMSAFAGNANNQEQAPVVTPKSVPVAQQPIENKQELLAAISVAVAEELGTDVSGIRIHSIKRL